MHNLAPFQGEIHGRSWSEYTPIHSFMPIHVALMYIKQLFGVLVIIGQGQLNYVGIAEGTVHNVVSLTM